MFQIYLSNIRFSKVPTIFYIKFILCLFLSCMVYVMCVTQMANLYISTKNHDYVT